MIVKSESRPGAWLRDNPFAISLQAVTAQAAIDLLPAWARSMHGLERSPLFVRPMVLAGALGIAGALRWAFAEK